MTFAQDCLRKQNIPIIRSSVLAVEYIRKQQFFPAVKAYRRAVTLLTKGLDFFLEMLPEVNGQNPFMSEEMLAQTLVSMQNAQEQEDYILLADLLEASFLPMLTECQARLVAGQPVAIDDELLYQNVSAADKSNPGLITSLFQYDMAQAFDREGKLTEAGYQAAADRAAKAFQKGCAVEYAADGGYTVAVPGKNGKLYLHTNNMIARESFALASEWLAQGDTDYLFYGLGFGYPYQRMLVQQENMNITVVEGNQQVLLLAFLFAPLHTLLKRPNFKLEFDATNRRFMDLAAARNGEGCYVCAPMYRSIRNEKNRQKLEAFFMSESSYRTQRTSLDGNFKSNRAVDAENVWTLQEHFKGKDVYIAAAGPSLDKNMLQLKKLEEKENAVLLAVGTVYRKLAEAGIALDYVIVTDAGAEIHRQLEGLSGVPLLFLSTANARAVKDYDGEKYRIYQEGYPAAQAAAKAESVACMETGGSVATTALSTAVRLGAARVIFVGLDLAYTDGKDHADGTKRGERPTGGANTVEASDGTLLATARNWTMYREWMENYIANMRRRGDARPVIDATEGGARKQGMKVMTLAEAMTV